MNPVEEIALKLDKVQLSHDKGKNKPQIQFIKQSTGSKVPPALFVYNILEVTGFRILKLLSKIYSLIHFYQLYSLSKNLSSL